MHCISNVSSQSIKILKIFKLTRINAARISSHNFQFRDRKNRNGSRNITKLKNSINLIPKPYDIQLELDCVGLCRDSTRTDKERLNGLPVEKQTFLGCGGSGIVHDVGKYVSNFGIGDRVCLEAVLPCQSCSCCVSGQHGLCHNFKPQSPVRCGKDKRLTKYCHVPGDFCHKLEDHVTMEEGALIEPVAKALKACRTANIHPNDNVLVIGAGSIGLVTLQLCKAMGANVMIIDTLQWRLNVAKTLNANHTLLIDNDVKTYDIVYKIQKTISTPIKAIDCAGTDFTRRLCTYSAKPSGRAVSCSTDILSRNSAFIEGDDITSYSRDFKDALHLITTGVVNVKVLISHHFDKSEIYNGIGIVQNSLNGIVKAMIHFQPKDKNNQVES